jgi:hypothetical protein
MTTPAAAEKYLNEHRQQWGGRPFKVHNPHNKPLEELPVIYGFNNGGSPGWYHAVSLAADGTCLGLHICSHEDYMPADLGLIENSRLDREEAFAAHYPEGYRCEFVPCDEVTSHAGLTAAYALNQEQRNNHQPKE